METVKSAGSSCRMMVLVDSKSKGWLENAGIWKHPCSPLIMNRHKSQQEQTNWMHSQKHTHTHTHRCWNMYTGIHCKTRCNLGNTYSGLWFKALIGTFGRSMCLHFCFDCVFFFIHVCLEVTLPQPIHTWVSHSVNHLCPQACCLRKEWNLLAWDATITFFFCHRFRLPIQ